MLLLFKRKYNNWRIIEPRLYPIAQDDKSVFPGEVKMGIENLSFSRARILTDHF